MGEEAELQARILELEDRIAASSRHAPQTTRYTSRTYRSAPYYLPRSRGVSVGRGRGRGRSYGPTLRRGASSPAGRGLPIASRNEWIASQQSNMSPGDSSWVTKNLDASQQPFNSAVRKQETTHGPKEAVNTHLRHDTKEQTPLNKFPITPPTESTSSGPSSNSYGISITGMSFRVTNGGSKLTRTTRTLNASLVTNGQVIRDTDEANFANILPQSTQVAGVTFRRTKNGNYIRKDVIPTQKYHVSPSGKNSRLSSSRATKLCPKFTSTGICHIGPRCKFTHNPDKVAICKEFLQKGACSNKSYCNLSHELTPHRVPACLYFQRGNCTNAQCRYLHVIYKPGALVCSSFAKLGYCEKGAECPSRHVNECPEHANTGVCKKKDCRLPHIDRAAQLRKVAGTTTPNNPTDANTSDISSDEESGDPSGEDVDSDDLDEEVLLPKQHDTANEFEQQLDFVQL